MRLTAILVLMLLLTACLGEARLPKVGDMVGINVLGPLYTLSYEGAITDIDENMISMECFYMAKVRPNGYVGETVRDWNTTNPEEICIGKGVISKLVWISVSGPSLP
jgi:hypothetical protein